MPVKFNSGAQDNNRERQVNEVMEAFFGEDGYDEEMKTMVSELFNVYNDDRGQVEKQVQLKLGLKYQFTFEIKIRELGFGQTQQDDSSDSDDDDEQARLAAEQAAREE